MIRPVTPADTPAVLRVVESSGLFPPDGLGEIRDALGAYAEGALGEGHSWILDADGDDVAGVAYYAPEAMTDGAWNLLMIAVDGDRQGEGRGGALLRAVEADLAERGGRLLIVDTSGMDAFEATRSFYVKHGYEEEARIRDYWGAGDDKVTFRKALASA